MAHKTLPDGQDALEVVVVNADGSPVGGAASSTAAPGTAPATEATQLQVLAAIQASKPAQLRLTALAPAQAVYALAFAPTDAVNSRLEFNGVTYRLTGGDYTIASATLTLTNPVIAPLMGDTFTLITA